MRLAIDNGLHPIRTRIEDGNMSRAIMGMGAQNGEWVRVTPFIECMGIFERQGGGA